MNAPGAEPTSRESATYVELVCLLTYGSWLNWIESEFTALRYFALNGTDHRTHDEQNTPSPPTFVGATPALSRRRTSPPPIRQWTEYPVNVA
ncbi:hypothetical protein ACIRP2_35715 [Streptomyces sp. NPDC101194]|uniref:hypothetical protein n=1 Tax=Streptomyces sp. NPDC101194 TaxID=3366127 RepID=UPI0037FA956A